VERVPRLQWWVVPVSCLLGFLPTPVTGQEIPDELDLVAAVRLALDHHPALKVSDAAVAGAEGLIEQGRLRPNPLFTVQTENWRFGGDPSFHVGSDLDLFAYVSQPFELGGKRERRVELAEQEKTVAELRRRQLEWQIRQQVRRSFWQAFLAQREFELLEENARLFEQVTNYHEIRVREGAMAEADLIRVRLEEERLQLTSEEAAVRAERSRTDLIRAMGGGLHSLDFRLIGEPTTSLPSRGIGVSELLEQVLQARPDLQSMAADVERARRQVRLAEARSRPDWEVIFGYKRTEGFNTVLGGVSIPLPIFDRNQGNIRFNQSEVDRAEALLRERQRQAQTEVAGAVAALGRRASMLRRIEEGMLERAEESWQISLAAYREGATDLLRLLDAQRSRNEVRLLRIRTRLELQVSLVDLEEAVGVENLPIGLETVGVQP
jgi:cobalt-zinc-cadmium efflux system outer membrane protein